MKQYKSMYFSVNLYIFVRFLEYFPWVYIYPTPLLGVGCNSKTIIKQITAGLNSEFIFKTAWCTKPKELNLPYNNMGWGSDTCIF